MANLETAAVLEPYAKYMLASEEIEPGGGWDYRAILNAVSGDRLSRRDLGKPSATYYKKCDAKGRGNGHHLHDRLTAASGSD
ncbi:MAG: clostripain-related cysteine peptidase [Hydrogeniiclostridium mannosilyticum]